MEIKFENCGKIRLETDVDHKYIDVELYYGKGGWNYFTCTQERRGYYISAQPISVKDNMYSFIAFSGRKMCLSECSRKSGKAEREAVKAVIDRQSEILAMITYVAKQNGLEVSV